VVRVDLSLGTADLKGLAYAKLLLVEEMREWRISSDDPKVSEHVKNVMDGIAAISHVLICAEEDEKESNVSKE
jgi:hypothetical protein